MNLTIYTRDDGGIIEFRGTEAWSSVGDFLDATFGHRNQADNEEYADLAGWPDEAVYWYGNTGIAVRNDPLVERLGSPLRADELRTNLAAGDYTQHELYKMVREAVDESGTQSDADADAETISILRHLGYRG